MKFDMTTRKQIDISAGPKELSSSFSASGCECDNMVMESHYKVYFAYEDLTDLSNPASSGTPSTPGGSTPGGANTPGGTTGSGTTPGGSNPGGANTPGGTTGGTRRL
jgi:hypothetical protein